MNKVIIFLLIFFSSFTMSKTTDTSYKLKEGDILSITLNNDPSFEKDFVIDKSGEILLPEYGKLKVSGKTELELLGEIKEKLKKFYKSISQLKLFVKEKRMYINILGYVKEPQEMLVPDNANIELVISKAGGVRKGAQLNKMQLQRKDELIFFNYKNYLDSGDESLLPYLKTKDSIFIPSSPLIGDIETDFNIEHIQNQRGAADIENSIIVFGEVHRPGIYNYKDQTVVEYIMEAGGVTRYGDVSKIRVIIKNKPYIFNLKYFLDNPEQVPDMKLSKGSTIYVPIMTKDIEKTGSQVFLMGEVKAAGVYEIDKGKTTFFDVLASAGGPTRFADSTKLRILKQTGQIINFNLSDYVNKVGNQKVPHLEAGDVILIPEKVSYAENAWLQTPSDEAVHVLGAVNNPGRFPWSNNMTLIDLIAHSEGPTQNADLDTVKIITYGLDGKQEIINFNLNKIMKEGINYKDLPKIKSGYSVVFTELPHDPTDNKSKWIRQSSERSIYVFGAVNAAGRYAFDNSMSFLDLFAAAEGPIEGADINAIQIVHRNKFETSVETFDFGLYMMTGDETLLPKIQTGDSIFVPFEETKFFNKNSENTIKVMGAVNKTGFYRYNDDLTIVDVLTTVEGFKDNAIIDQIFVVNMSCCDTGLSYAFDLEGFLEDPKYVDLPALRPGDIIFIPSRDQGEWATFMDAVGDAVLIATLLALVGVF